MDTLSVETREQQWESRRAELCHVGDDGETPLDEGIVELVCALSLFGFPTIGSCEGHPVGKFEYAQEPFVGMGYRMASRWERKEGDWFPTDHWLNPHSGDRREIRYLAALAWTRYRPLAWKLRRLLTLFEDEWGKPGAFRVSVGWWGLCLIPREQKGFFKGPDEETSVQVVAWQKEIQAFGEFLHKLWLDGRGLSEIISSISPD